MWRLCPAAIPASSGGEECESNALLVYDLHSADPATTVQRVECDEVPDMPRAAIDHWTVVCRVSKLLRYP